MRPTATLPLLLTTLILASRLQAMEPIRIAPDGKGFILAQSGQAFVPWGFNYDHDESGRLIEDYWNEEWPRVEADFREMADLGANVVRVHLQFGRFMEAADRPIPRALDRLGKLLDLAEKTGLYLDLTGLGCYHKKDVPAWYDALSESDRWAAQAAFWRIIAGRCKHSPAVFCYDLMNEPVVPGGPPRKPGDWLGPPFGDKHFVQVITLDQAGRPRPEIARKWIETLARAIRQEDPHHLITVGMVDWSLDRPGLTSGFDPTKVAGPLDFVSVHVYPERGKVEEALKTLKGFDLGKPVVIEETFPLKCSQDEFARFMKESRSTADGWIGFYWGKTPGEMKPPRTIGEALTLGWLEFFQAHKP
jgi:hypothetical protein